jgi:hypothetical protein
MSTILFRPVVARPQSRRAWPAAVVAVMLAAAAGIAAMGGFGEPSLSEQASPPAAEAWPGRLTADERAAVSAALASDDERTRGLAVSVAAGEAGVSALADPAILHHHGVDTSETRAPRRTQLAPLRFHHR